MPAGGHTRRGITSISRGEEVARKPRSLLILCILAVLAALGIAGLTYLGVWQIERRVWKLQLIEQVEERIHAQPVAVPGPASWPQITAADSYLKVGAHGRYLNDRETLVQAVTDLGSGFWVITPFRTNQGFTILVNRGFVTPDRRDPTQREAGQIVGETSVTGLLRMTEPKGGFLRNNDSAADRWYSRDVEAIAKARDLSSVAPFFIDADGTTNPGGWPVGGLTVVTFNNNHLVYAVTWFGLALMLIAATVFVAIGERRLRTDGASRRAG